MRPTTPLPAVLVLALGLTGCGPSSAPGGGSAQMGEHGSEGIGVAGADYGAQVAEIDEILMGPIREGQIAGASIAVIHRGQPVAIRGYGWADLELGVPTFEDAIYEMGSVTKQFTSAALLQLQEEGKVDLDAEIGTYLPDFPTQGNRITVRELLDHTSGIRGYTEMESARPYFIRRVPPDSLVALFAAHPFDFSTGEHEIYNNSAFFLAGLIVEKTAGKTYEEYVEGRIFGPLGMDRSHYCSETEIHEGKVNGYEVGPEGLVHKGFIVHSVPYAAGSLCASPRDIATWLEALHGGEVISEDSYRQLTTPGDLNDGTKLRYGLGIALSDIMGHRAVHHGGGINGFLTESIYLPDEELIVVVMSNTAGPPSPTAIARDIIEVMVGDATPEPGSYSGDLSVFEGTYSGPARAGPAVIRIAVDGDDLTATMLEAGGQPIPEDRQEAQVLAFRDGTTFAQEDALFTFEPEGGPATTLRWDVVAGYTVMKRR